MKILISRADLVDALDACSRLAGKNKSIPVLSNVHITSNDNVVTFESSSVDFSVRKHKESIESDNCDFLIDCVSLLKYVKLVKADNIRIVVNDKLATIEHPAGKLKMPIQASDTFPESQFNVQGETQTVTLPTGGFLAKAISDASLFVGYDDFHPAMKTLRVFSNDRYVGYSATDTRKLVHCQIESFPPVNAEILISPDIFPLLASVSSHQCKVIISEKCVVFDFGLTQISQTKLVYKYPDVMRVIPKDNNTEVVVNRNEILSAMRRVSAMVSTSVAVRMDIDYDSIGFRAIDSDMQKDASESVPCKSPVKIATAMSAAVLIDALTSISDDEISIRFSNDASSRPMVISGASEPGKTILAMPMAIPNA